MQMHGAAGGGAVNQAPEFCRLSVRDTKALMPEEPSLQLHRLSFYFLIAFPKKIKINK